MLRLIPLLLILIAGFLLWQMSSRRALAGMKRRSAPLSDPVLSAHAACMAETLELPELDIRVLPEPAINGMVTHDGQIYLTSGLVDRYRKGVLSSAEVASVIAHEIGHLALGHTKRRQLDFIDQNAMRLLFGLLIGRIFPIAGRWIAAQAAALLASLVTAKLSRRDEFAADAYAAALMSKLGLGTGPQVALLEKLGAEGGGSGGAAWLASHPPIERRIAAITDLDRSWSEARDGAPRA